MCVCVLFSTNSITNFPATQVEEAGGGGESRRGSSRQSWWAMRMTTMLKLITPGELKCQHCQSCQQCGLFRRLILDLVTRGGSTSGSSVGKSSLLLLSQGNRNVYCQQAKVVVVGGAGGGASSACRVGHGSLGAQNHLRLYVFYGPRRQPRHRPSPVIASKTVGVWGGCLLHIWRRTS